MTTPHVDPYEYARDMASGINSIEKDEHVANCDQCRNSILEILKSNKKGSTPELPNSFFSLINSLTIGAVKFLVPSFRKWTMPSPAEKTEDQEPEPIRVLIPKTVKWIQSTYGRFFITILLTVLVLIAPTPEGMSDLAQRAIAAFVFTGSILALQPISLPLAALMVPVIQIILGVADSTQSFETFSRPVVFLILASLFLAEAFRKHGLSRRLALMTIVATGGKVKYLLLGIMGITAFLSMWVENTAVAAVLIPVALTISREIKDPDGARSLLVLLALGIAYSASLGGMVTIMGSASNAVASGFLVKIMPWQFMDWLKYGLPSFMLIFPVTWLLLIKLVPVSIDKMDLEPVKERLKTYGSITGNEKEILYTMLIAVIFWISGSYVESWLQLPSTMLSSAVVAIVAVLYLSIRNVILWDDIKGVSWGIFLIIGAGLSLGETLSRSGATDWLATVIEPVIVEPPLVISLLLIVFISALLTNILNNTTIAAVLVPVVITIAMKNPDFNVLQLVLPLTLATTFGYSLPSASGRMALIGASGIVTPNQMLKYGLIMTIVSSLLLALLFYVFALLNLI